MGSYEALFSRRALKYKAMGLKDKNTYRKRLPRSDSAGIHFSKKARNYFGKKDFFRKCAENDWRSGETEISVSL